METSPKQAIEEDDEESEIDVPEAVEVKPQSAVKPAAEPKASRKTSDDEMPGLFDDVD